MGWFLLAMGLALLGGRRRGRYNRGYYRYNQPAKRKRQSRHVLASPRRQQQRNWQQRNR